jgi:hypothetical protein
MLNFNEKIFVKMLSFYNRLWLNLNGGESEKSENEWNIEADGEKNCKKVGIRRTTDLESTIASRCKKDIKTTTKLNAEMHWSLTGLDPYPSEGARWKSKLELRENNKQRENRSAIVAQPYSGLLQATTCLARRLGRRE